MIGRCVFGLNTFGDVSQSLDGGPSTHSQVIRNIIEQAVLADRLGIDCFGVGEHHRADFSVSSPEIVLANIAGKTTQIRVGTAANVLPTDDPVRLYQRLATLNAVSGERAELILGRGWFDESFSLFGYDPSQSERLFESKLELFYKIIHNEKVSWRGQGRHALSQALIYPRMEYEYTKTWVAVGSAPNSALRVARYDFPMMLSIIGGPPLRSKPLIDIYRLACEKLSRRNQAVGVHSAGYVACSDSDATEEYWEYYKEMRDKIGSERGWPHFDKKNFLAEVTAGSLYVGSPETVAAKIARTIKELTIDRFDMRFSCGGLPHNSMMKSIELYATKVVPAVKNMLMKM